MSACGMKQGCNAREGENRQGVGKTRRRNKDQAGKTWSSRGLRMRALKGKETPREQAVIGNGHGAGKRSRGFEGGRNTEGRMNTASLPWDDGTQQGPRVVETAQGMASKPMRCSALRLKNVEQ